MLLLLPELAALQTYRLDKGLTWQQLSDAMPGRMRVPARTLMHLCTAPMGKTNGKPRQRRQLRDLTLHKLRLFIKHARIPVPRTAGHARVEPGLVTAAIWEPGDAKQAV